MIPYGRHNIDEDDIQAVVDILRSGALTQGPAIEAFEHAIGAYVGAKYAIALSSGTAGLHLAALVAGVGPSKTVITSPITFVASANAGLYAGGSVEFSDIDADTLNISPIALKQTLELNPNTKAVIPVHFGGLPCEMPAIRALAEDAGAIVIEDAAHALGAKYPDGRMVGCCAYSSMTVFSFHPVKAIAAGEGGMITTNDEYIYRKLLRLRSHGINKLDDPIFNLPQALTNGHRNPWYYEMQDLGFNYRITDIQCALALSQFRKLETFISRRRTLVNQYDDAFLTSENLRPAQNMGRGESAHHLYVLRLNFRSIKTDRADFMRALRDRNIGTQVHYIPVPAHPYYRRLGHQPDAFPNSQDYYQEALSIPLYYDLTDQQQNHVITSVKELIE